jgi:FKBP-type peptidyl-prolyl cis-trans isomerase
MKKYVTFTALAAMLVLVACGQDTMKFDGQTETGYPYVLHHDAPGDSPRIGDRIRYTRQIRLGSDSIISPRSEQTVLLPERIQLPKPAPADFETLLLLSPGDSASVYVFGERLMAIPNTVRGPKDTIIYDIHLIEIVETREQRESVMSKSDEAEGRVTQAITAHKKGLLDNTLITTASGLKILHIREGSAPPAREGQEVEVHYCGMLEDKNMFDNSFDRGAPINFELGAGRVIKGWDEGLALIGKGGSAILIIPPDLAYGAKGSPPRIPPNATLYFLVDVLNVR